MNALVKGVVTVAAVVAAAGAGLWAGQTGLLVLPLKHEATMAAPVPAPKGPVIYYRDPSGKPLYSATPAKTPSGEPYLPVYASEERAAAPASVPLAQTAEAAGGGGERKPLHYRNPMGLPDISPVPKKDSMGMDYIPVYADEVDEGNTVKISPEKIQRSGVKTEEVAKRQVVRDIHAPGVVQLDERRIVVVAPRFDGYIEKVGHVTSGTHVKKGEPLATLFGQELLNQAARLLVEQDLGPSSDEMPKSPKARSGGVAGVVGARRRLLNLGAPEDFIDEVKRTRRVPDAITWASPITGVVLERSAVDGQGFKAGDVLFRIADHSVIWVIADVAEGDIGAVKAGQPVKVTTRAYPGRVFAGRVAVVYPHLMKETRTAQVRIELENPDLALLPDMYADVDIHTGDEEPVVAVPRSAVIDSGSRRVVIIDLGGGKFEPRDVEVGSNGDGYVEIASGVKAGERVVVDGNFLIDSESNLQSALKGLTSASGKEARQ